MVTAMRAAAILKELGLSPLRNRLFFHFTGKEKPWSVKTYSSSLYEKARKRWAETYDALALAVKLEEVVGLELRTEAGFFPSNKGLETKRVKSKKEEEQREWRREKVEGFLARLVAEEEHA